MVDVRRGGSAEWRAWETKDNAGVCCGPCAGDLVSQEREGAASSSRVWRCLVGRTVIGPEAAGVPGAFLIARDELTTGESLA